MLIGHSVCHVIIETTEKLYQEPIEKIIHRIAGDVKADILIVPQDVYLTNNQKNKVRCGDNGIFKGMHLTDEQKELSKIAREIYNKYPFDGKYILDVRAMLKHQSLEKPIPMQK
mgnify:CR=1 FL=1